MLKKIICVAAIIIASGCSTKVVSSRKSFSENSQNPASENETNYNYSESETNTTITKNFEKFVPELLSDGIQTMKINSTKVSNQKKDVVITIMYGESDDDSLVLNGTVDEEGNVEVTKYQLGKTLENSDFSEKVNSDSWKEATEQIFKNINEIFLQ